MTIRAEMADAVGFVTACWSCIETEADDEVRQAYAKALNGIGELCPTAVAIGAVTLQLLREAQAAGLDPVLLLRRVGELNATVDDGLDR